MREPSNPWLFFVIVCNNQNMRYNSTNYTTTPDTNHETTLSHDYTIRHPPDSC